MLSGKCKMHTNMQLPLMEQYGNKDTFIHKCLTVNVNINNYDN